MLCTLKIHRTIEFCNATKKNIGSKIVIWIGIFQRRVVLWVIGYAKIVWAMGKWPSPPIRISSSILRLRKHLQVRVVYRNDNNIRIMCFDSQIEHQNLVTGPTVVASS